jgi:hypothetical protein
MEEKRRLRVFENVLRRIYSSKREEVTGERRKLHNEKLNDLLRPQGRKPPRWGFRSGCKYRVPALYLFAFGSLGRRVWEIGVLVGID